MKTRNEGFRSNVADIKNESKEKKKELVRKEKGGKLVDTQKLPETEMTKCMSGL